MRTPRSAVPRCPRRPAFTLIEILIVVVILGILAGIVFPQFSNASYVAKENTMREDLRYMRAQITAYRLQHRDVAPGYPGGSTAATPTEQAFVDQMTQCTNEASTLGGTIQPSNAFSYGPYLSKLPVNPLTKQGGLWVVSGPSMPDPDPAQPFGWIYNPDLQKFIANVPGTDEQGTPYSSY